MTFKVFIDSDIFYDLPPERRTQIKEALKELENPLPGGRKKKVKGHIKGAYRLRVGDFRVMYKIDFETKEVFVFDILTAEQAHEKYDRLI